MIDYINDDQVFKFRVDDEGLTIKISHEDIKRIVDCCPDNCYMGLGKVIETIEGKEKDLAIWFIKGLMDMYDQESGDTVLGHSFEKVLSKALCGYENKVFNYLEYDE